MRSVALTLPGYVGNVGKACTVASLAHCATLDSSSLDDDVASPGVVASGLAPGALGLAPTRPGRAPGGWPGPPVAVPVIPAPPPLDDFSSVGSPPGTVDGSLFSSCDLGGE